jgi:hypothetical protein
VGEGSPWEQPAPEHLSNKHTHPLRKPSRGEGVGGNCRRSALTAARCFAWKKRSQANPAGVKFHRSLTCNDITKQCTPPPLPRNLPPPRARPGAPARQPCRVGQDWPHPGRACCLGHRVTLSLHTIR